MQWTAEEREQALDLAEAVGYAAAHERTAVPINTLRSWAARAGRTITVKGASTPRGRETVAAVETALLSMVERKAALAEGLMDDIVRLRADLFAPTIERKAMAAGQMRQVEIVEIEHATTTAAERRTTIQAITGAIEAVQLLTGEATERIAAVVERRPEIEQELAQVIELVREAS